MKHFLRILSMLLLAVVLLPCKVYGIQEIPVQAKEISSIDLVTHTENIVSLTGLFDKNLLMPYRFEPEIAFTLHSDEGIGSLYFIFLKNVEEYQLINEDTGESYTCGSNRFLHEYLDLVKIFGMAPDTVTVRFGEKESYIMELRVFTEGEVPDDIQKWRMPSEEGVDLAVFSAHGDDEQLFFAGLLPYYAVERGYEVQVIYSTDHWNYNTPERAHEMLNGLWAVGVRNYPVFGTFPDIYCKTAEEAEDTLSVYGYGENAVEEFIVEQLRKLKPLVAVGHDIHGEYGHGFHKLYGRSLQSAVEHSGDSAYYPDSAEKWGAWEVPKTYLHLYPEGKIHMNWDEPMEKFGGMTPYQVTKELGYPAHVSQYTGFAWYFCMKDTAEDIQEIGPCDYGLCRTTVGPDVKKDDLFENLLSRGEQKKMEEEARRQRLAEEAERERLRQEEERKQREAEVLLEQQKAEEEKQQSLQAAEEAKKMEAMKVHTYAISASVLAGLLVAWILVKVRKKEK